MEEQLHFIAELCLIYIYHIMSLLQWITSYHNNHTTTRVITHWRVYVTPLTTSMSAMCFIIEIMFSSNAIKSHFNGPFDKQNLTLSLSSHMKFMKLAEGSFIIILIMSLLKEEYTVGNTNLP